MRTAQIIATARTDETRMDAIAAVSSGVERQIRTAATSQLMTREQALRAAWRGLLGASVALGASLTVATTAKK